MESFFGSEKFDLTAEQSLEAVYGQASDLENLFYISSHDSQKGQRAAWPLLPNPLLERTGLVPSILPKIGSQDSELLCV